VSELLEALANVGAYVLALGLVGWGLYRVFGTQVFGVPAMVGLLVVIAGGTIFSNIGLLALAVVVVGLLVLVMVIGMAMTLGPEKPIRPEGERPPDDSPARLG